MAIEPVVVPRHRGGDPVRELGELRLGENDRARGLEILRKGRFIWRHKVGEGEWTAVYGIMEGTFTKPMTTADGTIIPPNGKAFKLPMATISHWTKDGPMDEEYLFWDNETYTKQIGLK